MQTKRTQVYLRKEQHNLLIKQAAKRHVSMAELIRQAIDKFLKELAIKNVEKDTFSEIVGVGESGIADISEKHDVYLYGKAVK